MGGGVFSQLQFEESIFATDDPEPGFTRTGFEPTGFSVDPTLESPSLSPSASHSPSSSVSASVSPSSSDSPSASISPSESIHQFAYPTADIATGGWTPSTPAAPLYSMINEPSVPDFSNYITSPICDGRLAVQLREGTTLIAERVLMPTLPETHLITLTTEERDLITNWGNLSIWLDVYVVGQIVKCALGPMNPPFPGTVTLYVSAFSE